MYFQKDERLYVCKFPDILGMRRFRRVKRMSVCKWASRNDERLSSRWSTAGFIPMLVSTKIPLYVLAQGLTADEPVVNQVHTAGQPVISFPRRFT